MVVCVSCRNPICSWSPVGRQKVEGLFLCCKNLKFSFLMATDCRICRFCIWVFFLIIVAVASVWLCIRNSVEPSLRSFGSLIHACVAEERICRRDAVALTPKEFLSCVQFLLKVMSIWCRIFLQSEFTWRNLIELWWPLSVKLTLERLTG